MNMPTQDDRWADLFEQVRESRAHSRQLQARLRFLAVAPPVAVSDFFVVGARENASRLLTEPDE